jgi:hypothetical protein
VLRAGKGQLGAARPIFVTEKAELGCRASHFRNSQFRNTLAFGNSAERKPRGKQHGDSTRKKDRKISVSRRDLVRATHRHLDRRRPFCGAATNVGGTVQR